MKYENYDIYKPVETQDGRGNIKRTWELKGNIRGSLVDKEVSLVQTDIGMTITYIKIFVTNSVNKNLINMGDKIDNLVVESIFLNAGNLVAVLTSEK